MNRNQLLSIFGLLLLAALPLVLPSYWLYLATSILISSLLALSVGVVTGSAGMVSLCQLSFAGLAGWLVAWFNANEILLPFVLQIFVAALLIVPIGVLIGLPALRVRGMNLAVVTLGFAAVVDLFFSINYFPGGLTGKAVVRPPLLVSLQNYYWFCLAIFGLVALGLIWNGQRRLGSSWLAVKHSERATAAMGLSVPLTKLTAFAMSAFIAGLGGGLMAGQLGILSPDAFLPVGSMILFAGAVMTGARYVGGALLAGALQWLIPEILNRAGLPPDVGNLIFAFGTIQALKDGGGVFEQIARRRKAEGRRQRPEVQGQASPISNFSSPISQKPVLDCKDLTITFGQVIALNHVNITVYEGRIMGLIGPNGAGKSSLINAVSGFIAYSGTVALNGQAMDSLSATQRACAGLRRSFQLDRTIPDLSIRSYLNLSAGRTLGEDELGEALRFTNVSDPQVELHSLNVGTRRLLEVAGLLAAKPKIVLLDEPAAGLSSEESVALGHHIAQLPARYGCAVLLVEHDMELVRIACQDVTVLDFGEVLAHGATAETLALPVVAKAYLGEEVAA